MALEPIAIIGLSFRLPQNVEDELSFWDMLSSGRNVMTEWPESRANVSAFYSPTHERDHVLKSKGAHFLSGEPGAFDAPFFSITSKEAASMDPQQRWLLESSYRALENAGIPVENVAGTKTGVFAASMSDDYMRILAKDPEEAPANINTGTAQSILANRLSWYFDLRGPSIQLNTACSSSLVALHLACNSLRSGESSSALVVGSNAILSVEPSLYLSTMNFLSPDSRCFSFDHRANGYGRGEGVVALVLKRLSDATRDGDLIRAVVRASGTNQDGLTPGITQPNPDAQEDLIREVYKSCGLGFESTRFVEAHGTGTQLGDATEVKALTRVFRGSRSPEEPLYIGSIKANIGHLEAASGLAGVLKTILVLEKGVIPPNALFEKLNPKLDSRRAIFKIPTSCIPWPNHGVRRVSINSFGFGGANCHAIMDDTYHTLQELALRGYRLNQHLSTAATSAMTGDESASYREGDDFLLVSKPVEGQSIAGSDAHDGSENVSMASTNVTDPDSLESGVVVIPPKKHHLLVWSARNESALKKMIQDYDKYNKTVVNSPEDEIGRLAYTLAVRRSLMAWRSFAVVEHGKEFDLERLSATNRTRSVKDPGLAFIFTGQGAQYRGMGMELSCYTVFQSTLEKIGRVYRELGAEWSLLDEMASGDRIDLPQFSQPICTALQIALVELLNSFSIVPVAVVGHSSGEIAAAYAAGALSLESACKVAFHRGRLVGALLASTPIPGAMMSVNLSQEDAYAYLEKCGLKLDVACVNSPSNVTLAGDECNIDSLKGSLDHDHIFSQKLNTGVAYHTQAMQQVASEYLSCLGHLEQRDTENSVLLVSSVTGDIPSFDTVADGQYWVDNLVSPVLFSNALHYLAEAAPKVDQIRPVIDYLEVGPHAALRRPVTDTLNQLTESNTARYASILHRLESPLKTTMEAAGGLATRGHPVSLLTANQLEMHQFPPLADTPGYPFDHSQIYWHESRLSRDWRLREPVSTSLLGIRATDWNPLEPRWRKLLSIKEIPWIGDHLVGNVAFFPATGTLIMAIEAVMQMAQPHRAVSGYQIEEATFMSPIVVRDDGKTEITTHLHPLQKEYEKASARFEVNIFTLLEDDWKKCFQAIVNIDYELADSLEVGGGHEGYLAAQGLTKRHEHAGRVSTLPINKETFYKWHLDQGINYGESFALADDICWDGGENGIARVNVAAHQGSLQGFVHPAILDASCQVIYAAPSQGMSESLPTIIPYRLHDAWISASHWPDTQVHIATTSRFNPTVSGIEGSVIALAPDATLLFHVDRFELRPIMGQKTIVEEQPKYLHSIDWQPHMSLLSPEQLRSYCKDDESTKDKNFVLNYNKELEEALRAVLQHNVNNFCEADLMAMPSHLQKYVAWAKEQLQQYPGLSNGQITDKGLDDELTRLEAARPSWRLFIEVAHRFMPIMLGEADVLDIALYSPAAQDFYDALFASMNKRQLRSFLQLASHQNPNLKILEVGAGTGGMTNMMLSILEQFEAGTGGSAFSEYVYTDVSAHLFEKAASRFAGQRDRMSFKSLDLDCDIITQGFEPASFDLIFAGSVLHATKNLVSTLQNIRRVLKPGGRLIFHEITTENSFTMSFLGGLSPEWWRGEEESRIWCPTVSENGWDSILRDSGFSGIDMLIRDYEHGAAHTGSIIISTVDESKIPVAEYRTIFVIMDDNDYQTRLAKALETEMCDFSHERNEKLTLSQWSATDLAPSDHVVFLCDVGYPLLVECTDRVLQYVQRGVQKSNNLLWVSSNTSYGPEMTSLPHTGLKDGLLRTLRVEYTNKHIVALTIEDEFENIPSCAKQILRVFRSAFEGSYADLEYISRGNMIYSSRLVAEPVMSSHLSGSTVPQTRIEPWLPGPPLTISIGSRGSLETLQYIEDLRHGEVMGPKDVEIEAKAWAVNFRDVFNALGRMDDPGFGSDCAGIVTRVGSECNQVQPGDRVIMCAYDCMRTYPRGDEFCVAKIPDSISFESACAVVTPGITAVWSLLDLARIRKGDKVLIHSASGATGQVAVQVCQMVGAEVFATVGHDHKKQFLIDTYGIPETHIFYSRNTSFAKGVKRVTNGYGVDVVLNSLIGESLQASWQCLAPFGRFVEIGKADINANSGLPMAQFAENLSFFAVDLHRMFIQRKDLSKGLLDKTIDLVNLGKIRSPAPLHIYDVSDVEKAFRSIQSGRNMGRVIIRIDRSTTVTKHLIDRASWAFDENATYVIAGGLGGIGRSLVKWMVSKRAKHFIIPSRSGPTSQAARDLLDELAEQGVAAQTPKCDISSTDILSSTLREYECSMPPIRGCINATMVLNDAIFDNMRHTQWAQTVSSKAQASWNLHVALPKDLDFFILLSSISGIIGNGGQSNYAAGCTFQDSLAQYCAKHYYNAVSIDLGAMRSIGVIAETEALLQRVGILANLPTVEEDELFRVLEACCNPKRRLSPEPERSQVVLGAATPVDLLSQGLEPVEFMNRPLFSHFSQAHGHSHASGTNAAANGGTAFRQAESETERAQIVVESLAVKLARALAIEPEDVDAQKPLHAFGVDSLVAVELRNWFAKEFIADIPVFEIMGAKTITALGHLVTQASQVKGKG